MYAKAFPVDVGYCLTDDKSAFAFEPPRTVMSKRTKPLGMRSVQNCPAVNGLERQLVEIPAPIALRMRLSTANGELGIQIDPKGTFARPDILRRMLTVEPPERWREPKKPVLQMELPFFFVTDEPCWANILPPFLSPFLRRLPGTVVAARYPVSDWPQSIRWALEWDDLDSELLIRQGEVLAYAMFEFDHADKRPRLLEAEMTPELEEYRAGMVDLHHMTDQIEEVWVNARARRPKTLLSPLRPDDTDERAA
jgi:hypothetical protein